MTWILRKNSGVLCVSGVQNRYILRYLYIMHNTYAVFCLKSTITAHTSIGQIRVCRIDGDYTRQNQSQSPMTHMDPGGGLVGTPQAPTKPHSLRKIKKEWRIDWLKFPRKTKKAGVLRIQFSSKKQRRRRNSCTQ